MSARRTAILYINMVGVDAHVFCESAIMNWERRGTGWCGERRELLEIADKITWYINMLITARVEVRCCRTVRRRDLVYSHMWWGRLSGEEEEEEEAFQRGLT
jgi:hypothetical protein